MVVQNRKEKERIKMKKNVFLADCSKESVTQFAEELQYHSKPFEVKVDIANWKRTGRISELKRYAIYFWVGFRSFLCRGRYDVVIGWQQFYALIFCFFCSVFSVKKQNTVIALNYTYKEKKGKLQKVYRWFMAKCISAEYMDYIHVLSDNYANYIHHEFGFPRERIIVTSFGVVDLYDKLKKLAVPNGFLKDGYALAIGRSNRDYDFLIRAWKDIDYPLVIISDTYTGRTDDKHISILTNVAGEESHPWIVHCGLMVIPIDDGSICSGDTVLLNAMSLERKIVVTSPSTLAEMYIHDGRNAVLTKKNEEEFRRKVKEVLYLKKYEDLGRQARESFLESYTLRSMGRKVTYFLNQN